MWSNDEVGWKGLYLDVKRWMAINPELARRVGEIIKRRGSGRNRLDEGDKSWQDAFCEAYFKHNGNKAKARVESGCPYSLRRVLEMLDPANTAYDKEFAEKVLEKKLEFTADFEEMAIALRDPSIYTDTNASKIAMNKSVVATRILEKVAAASNDINWKRELNVKGQILHQVDNRYRSRQELLEALVEEKKQFEKNRSNQVLELASHNPVSPKEKDGSEIDCEVVDETD